MNERITYVEMCHRAGMSARPEYYSGRRASSSDLSSKHLEAFYGFIKDDWGEAEARTFVQFVNDLNSLAATPFLIAFQELVYCEFRYQSPVRTPENVAIGKNSDGSHEFRSAMGHMMAVMGNRGPDETDAIKQRFLANHRGEYRGLQNENPRYRSSNYNSNLFELDN